MRERSLSSVVIVLIVILPTLVGGLVFALLWLTLGLLAFREFLTLVEAFADGAERQETRFGMGAIILFAITAYMSSTILLFYAIVALALAAPLLLLLRTTPSTTRLSFAALLSSGTVGFGLAVYAAISLRETGGTVTSIWLQNLAQTFAIRGQPSAGGLAWVLVVILCTWMNDSGAYLVGRSLGRHPLAPNVSPRKTLEGSAAGLIGSTLVGVAGFVAFGIGDWWLGALAGCAIGVAGQLGDLTESYLKRAAGVKDSGNLIPGHGGLLDRIDGLLFAFPVGFILASALEHLSS